MVLHAFEVASLVLTTLVGLCVGGLYKSFSSFVVEQREVNKANALAQRSMQRDVIYRYFHKAVEMGEPLTPEEFKHVHDCWTAYHANGANGTGDIMWDKIREHAQIETGRHE